MAFRIQSKNIFLTYSNLEKQLTGNCKETFNIPDKVDLLDWIKAQVCCEYAIVALEEHENGDHHFHAFLKLKHRPDIRDSRFFDWSNLHARIEVARSPNASKTYCMKDGNFVEYQAEVTVTGQDGLLDKCEEFEEKVDWAQYCCMKKIPFQYMDFFWNAVHNVDIHTILDDTPILGRMHKCLMDFEYREYETRNLVIVGPAGCGKTTWAKTHMPKPILMINHIDILKKFRPDYHRSILFDDMGFSHLPRESQINIVDKTDVKDIHRRYGTTSLPSGVVKVFTANIMPFGSDEAILRRIRVINIRLDPLGMTCNGDE